MQISICVASALLWCFISIESTGSIALGKENKIRAAPSTDPSRLWPKKTVYYKIDKALSNIKNVIESAFKEIEKETCVRYIRRTDQVDFVAFVPDATKCFEPVGRQGGQQTILINLSNCGSIGYFLHAAMQTLGFYHEHQRSDRDENITVYDGNIADGWSWAFDKLSEASHFRNSSYDVHSVMHYGSYQFSKNGQPTILTNAGEIIEEIQDRFKLSELDVEAINRVYNCHCKE